MLKNISADDAQDILLKLPAAPETETVKLEDALSRIAAGEITAKIPIPPFDRSPYDGYAFRGKDTTGATRQHPVELRIIEEIPAGKQPECEITSGCAAKILTGAPIPKGADSTIKYENTEFSDKTVRIFEEIPPSTDIIYAGTDVKPGRVLVSGGELITAPVTSSLANQGIDSVEVFKKPVITIINTGTELCEAGTELRPAAIYNSNVYTLMGYLREAGAEPVNGGVAPDEPDAIAERVGLALERSDMVITTGGASVGDYDWAVTSAERLGAEVLFWKTLMKPGGAIMAAVKDGKVILGLSGNPAAAVIGLLRIAMPYIRKLCGRSDCFYETVEVMLKEPLHKENPKLRILRGRLEIDGGRAYFAENTGRGSEAISSMIGCDLLGEIPAGSPPLPAGTIIKAFRV